MRFAVLLSLLFLSACQSTIPLKETPSNISPDDFSFSEAEPESPAEMEVQKIPETMYTKVSITIAPGTPLREVLMDLASQAGVDLAFNGEANARMSLSCQEQSFLDVVGHICEMSNLRYRIRMGMLIVEPDEPYIKTYHVPSLNFTRSTQNRIAVNTDLLNTNSLAPNNQNENSGTHVISGKTESDFWSELRENLDHILVPHSDSIIPAYTFHKQGGLVTITATDQYHRMVEKYFETLEKTTSAQVLIEAKIIEVTLKNEFHSGINWRTLSANLDTQGNLGSLSSTNTLPSLIIHRGNKINGVLSFIEHFGKTRTLSSPRITVLNNHSAVMKVAENNVYFRLKYTRYMRNKEQGDDVVFASSDIETVPIGLILTVQPSINTQKGEITLALRPTITSSTKKINDPAVDIQSKNEVHSSVPIVQVREVDSVMHLKNGDITVLGGLMQERHHEGTQGIPGARKVPILGKIISGNDSDRDVVELVIFVRVTILDPSNRKNQRNYPNVTA